MKVILNGKEKEFKDNISVSTLLDIEEILEPVAVEVFVNKKEVPFEKFDTYILKDGDNIEYLYLFASG